MKWTVDGCYIAVATGSGDTLIYDAETRQRLRNMTGHLARVGSLSWNNHSLASGCRDGSIWIHDVRIARHKVDSFASHVAEVCGLAYRQDGCMLASGANDNLVNIWDVRHNTPKYSKTAHSAAVKALSWCPWQLGLLASGGGSNDKRFSCLM